MFILFTSLVQLLWFTCCLMWLIMFKLLMVLVCLEVEFCSADPGKPEPPLLYKLALNGLKVPHYELQEPLVRASSRVRTVSVTCFPSYMEVHVKADLFELGVAVDPADLRLGTNALPGQACDVTSTSGEEYILQHPLTDCDARHWVTEEALIYSNMLVYSPRPSVDGLVRTESAAVPVECHYRRRFDIDADPVLPTWIPHQTTKTIQEKLDLTLRLMTSDWQWERGSAVYLLGDVINMEAAVFAPQLDLRVFIDRCVATPTHNVESIPRYDFVDNNGCLVDGLLTGSTSHFLPRERPDKLQLQLKAFIFQHVEPAQMYITCTLKAYPLKYASESMSKACSFFNGRWRSAEGDDWTCSSCQNQFQTDQLNWGPEISKYHPKPNSTESPQSPGKLAQFRPTMQEDSSQWELVKPGKGLSPRARKGPVGTWKHAGGSQKESGSVVLEQEVSVGPLSVRTWRNKVGVMVPPTVKEGVPSLPSPRGKKPIPHHSLWRNEETLDTGRDDLGTDADEDTDEDAAESQDLQGNQHSTEGGSLSVSTTTSPESTTVMVHPLLDSAHLAEDLDLATNASSPVHPSSSSTANATQSENVSEGDPGSLLKNPA